LRAISLPLGTKVPISLVSYPLRTCTTKNFRVAPPAVQPNLNKTHVQNTYAHAKRARARFLPTSKQSCSGENCGSWPSKGFWPCWTRAYRIRAQQPVACAGQPLQGLTSRIRMNAPSTKPVDGDPYTQTPGATPRKVSRIPDSRSRVNEKKVVPPSIPE